MQNVLECKNMYLKGFQVILKVSIKIKPFWISWYKFQTMIKKKHPNFLSVSANKVYCRTGGRGGQLRTCPQLLVFLTPSLIYNKPLFSLFLFTIQVKWRGSIFENNEKWKVFKGFPIGEPSRKKTTVWDKKIQKF